jgi:hypothetical protein
MVTPKGLVLPSTSEYILSRKQVKRFRDGCQLGPEELSRITITFHDSATSVPVSIVADAFNEAAN